MFEKAVIESFAFIAVATHRLAAQLNMTRSRTHSESKMPGTLFTLIIQPRGRGLRGDGGGVYILRALALRQKVITAISRTISFVIS